MIIFFKDIVRTHCICDTSFFWNWLLCKTLSVALCKACHCNIPTDHKPNAWHLQVYSISAKEMFGFSSKALRLGASIQMWSLGNYRGGVYEDRAAPFQAHATVLPRDTDEHIRHYQVWENIFKYGHKMPQNIEGREKRERGWRIQGRKKQEQQGKIKRRYSADQYSRYSNRGCNPLMESEKKGASERNSYVLIFSWAAHYLTEGTECNLCW